MNNTDKLRQTRNHLFIKQLRTRPTKAELQMKTVLDSLKVRYIFQKGFLKPFHRIVDFYIPKKKIIIEVDGGYHSNIIDKDRNKDVSFLNQRGFTTLRFTNEEVMTSASVIERLLTALKK